VRTPSNIENSYRIGEGTANCAIGQVNLRGLDGQLTPDIGGNIHSLGLSGI